jgi:hypothetical protein
VSKDEGRRPTTLNTKSHSSAASIGHQGDRSTPATGRSTGVAERLGPTMRASTGSRQLDSVSSTSVAIQARKSWYPQVPPKVEYTLSKMGIALGPSSRRSSNGPKCGGKYWAMPQRGNGAGSSGSPVGLFELMVTRLPLRADSPCSELDRPGRRMSVTMILHAVGPSCGSPG